VAPALRRAMTAMLGQRGSRWSLYAGYWLFDRWAAAKLRRAGARAVICYENAALHSFIEAERSGVLKILDAAAMHHATQDRLSETQEAAALHRWVGDVKDEEIRLADHIFTVSNLARDSYLSAGIPAEKISVIPVGVDLEMFRARSVPASDRFRFLFVGHLSHHKGFDLLLQAFSRVRKRRDDVDLSVIGSSGDAAHLLSRDDKGVSLRQGMKQAELPAAYSEADCLVLPSRTESFGMVVAEALACGVPVIVSDTVGAKDRVVTGKNGWIIPTGDVRALEAVMDRCVSDRGAVRAMRDAAQASSLDMGWPAYRDRLVAAVRRLLGP